MPDEGRMVSEGEMQRVGKQIRLPWSKAMEIAIKSMKIRFGRSVVTTASIVLAIAFLMSILTGTTLVTSLKTRPPQRVWDMKTRAQEAEKGTLSLALPTGPKVLDEAKQRRVGIQADLTKAKGLERRGLQAELDTVRALIDALNSPKNPEQAKVEWVKSRAKADLVAADNEWQLLVRKLNEEGYTNVKPEVTKRPKATSFIKMLSTEMDPRDKWLAILAAMVCFVGIWNAMLMSVHERFREIGTMKCLGALESFIVKLYFLESSFMGLAGTLMGILLGFLLSMVRAVSSFGLERVWTNFDFGGALLSGLGTLLIGSLLSIGAAIFPARSAAKMDPVVAMRVDE